MMATQLLKRLFCFKKPRVLQLSYIAVLVKDKPVLFVAWDISHAWTVKFISLRGRHDAAKHAAVVSIPDNLSKVTLEASNYWRKISIDLALNTVKLDETAIAQLIDGFRPLNKTEVNSPAIGYIKTRFSIKRLSIKQRNSSIQQIDRFKVTIQSLTPSVHPIHYQ